MDEKRATGLRPLTLVDSGDKPPHQRSARIPDKVLTPRNIAVLAVDDCQVLDVTGPLQVFATANVLLGSNSYNPGILALRPEPVQTNCGIQLLPHWDLTTPLPALDTLLLAGGRGVFSQLENRELIDWLARQPAEVRRLGSVCTGAFLLAEAGLAVGRRLTTHWRSASTLARRYPGVKVDDDAIWLHDGGLYSSAGVTAGMDLALALVEEDHGAELAQSIARELVVFRQREGGQAVPETGQRCPELPKPVQRVVDHIQEHCTQPQSLDDLAQRAGISSRHLSRLFVQALEQTPMQYLEDTRLQRAQQWLEQSERSLTDIAQCCGFSSADSLSRTFSRRYGVSPGRYRRTFNQELCG